MEHSEWDLTVGEIVAPFGLAGEVKVRLETDFPDRFSRLKQVCLRKPDGTGKLYTIIGSRQHKGQVLLRLQGIGSIHDVERLRNCIVQIRSYEAVRLPENEFYIHDLIGCEVVNDQGETLGKIHNVLRGIANDVYCIGEGKEELLLPAIKDVVKEVDLVARKIVVTPTPGLMKDPITVQETSNRANDEDFIEQN
jgi:16S rRNA processing protein RimM